MFLILPEPEWIDDPTRMMQVCREIKETGRSGIDTETTGLDLARDHVVVWSLSPSRDKRYCLSRRMLPIFREELADDPDLIWDMTNCNFDNNMLANSGVPLLKGHIRCTLVMDWLYDENERHGLKETAKRHLGLNMREFKKAFPRKRGEKIHEAILRVLDSDPASAWDYASMDAWASRELAEFLQSKLERIETSTGVSMHDLYENVEMPYHKVLYNCSRRGVMIDAAYLKEVSSKINEAIFDIQRKFNKLVGSEINLNSPVQLVDLFINHLKRNPVKWTSGGKSGNRQPSTDEDCLKVWAAEGCEYSQLLLEHRGLKKTEGTYCTGMINRADGGFRIHPMLTQHVAVTGRLSSTDPNLQNIPRPDGDTWGLRSAFMAGTGMVLVAADYKQLEMRLLAEMSGDDRMREVIRKGWDIHMGTASVMYGVPYEEIAKAKKEAGKLEAQGVPWDKWPERIRVLMGYRQDAKQIGFGLNYGKGVWALAEDLGVSKQEAEARIEKYFMPYPGVQDFIEETHSECRETLEVSTILGRKRRLMDANADWKEGFYSRKYRKYIPERPGKLAARALRQSVNSIIQGSAADVARLAQLRVEGLDYWRCRESEKLHDLGARQILQIHDEILFEVPEENLAEAKPLIQGIMSKPFWDLPERLGIDFRELSIPLDVDIGVGDAWSEAH